MVRAIHLQCITDLSSLESSPSSLRHQVLLWPDPKSLSNLCSSSYYIDGIILGPSQSLCKVLPTSLDFLTHPELHKSAFVTSWLINLRWPCTV